MNSLKEVYFALAEQDHVKLAQAQAAEQYGPDFSDIDPALIKQAQDYDTVGRIMAHNDFAEMIKEAVEEGMPGAPEEKKEDEVKKLLAKARGEAPAEKEKEEGEEEEEEEEEEEGEKKAAVKVAVLRRMQQDPEYVSYLLSKYNIG